MTLDQFLYGLVNGGGSAMLVSFILEKIPWYQNQTSDNKRYLFFGLTFLLTVSGYLTITYVPRDVINTMAPYFAMGYTTFASVFLGTAFHKITKDAKKDNQG